MTGVSTSLHTQPVDCDIRFVSRWDEIGIWGDHRLHSAYKTWSRWCHIPTTREVPYPSLKRGIECIQASERLKNLYRTIMECDEDWNCAKRKQNLNLSSFLSKANLFVSACLSTKTFRRQDALFCILRNTTKSRCSSWTSASSGGALNAMGTWMFYGQLRAIVLCRSVRIWLVLSSNQTGS